VHRIAVCAVPCTTSVLSGAAAASVGAATAGSVPRVSPAPRNRTSVVRVAPAAPRAVVAAAAAVLVGGGTLLPWQVVRFGGRRTSLTGWDVATGVAWLCVALAVVGLVAAWLVSGSRSLFVALTARLVLLGAGGLAAAVAGAEVLRARTDATLPGFSSRPGAGLAVVGAGAVGLAVAGAWAAWRPLPTSS
jgi:hypothetical protein